MLNLLFHVIRKIVLFIAINYREKSIRDQNIMRQFYFLILESTLIYIYNFAEGVSKRNISRKMASYYCFRDLPFKVQKPKGRVSLPFCEFYTHIRLPIFSYHDAYLDEIIYSV